MVRRQNQWQKYILKDLTNDYSKHDLPAIIKYFYAYWDVHINPNTSKIPATAMVSLLDEICSMLSYSHVLDFEQTPFDLDKDQHAVTIALTSSKSLGVKPESPSRSNGQANMRAPL